MNNSVFQSTLPSQGATEFDAIKNEFNNIFQSTLPSQGATNNHQSYVHTLHISIHAPLTGSDDTDTSDGNNTSISIHAPLTGSDEYIKKIDDFIQNFNPRSPHRERRLIQTNFAALLLFQSTLPSQGATANMHIKFLCDLLFSTLSSKNSFTLSRFPQTIT